MFSRRPLVWEDARTHEPLSDLSTEDCLTRPEDNIHEPLSDLKREVCSTIAEPVVQVAVRLVEQERGLELQVNSPESTSATMLPITNAIEAANVLKIEDLSAKPAAEVSEALSDLKRDVCSTKTEAMLSVRVRLDEQ